MSVWHFLVLYRPANKRCREEIYKLESVSLMLTSTSTLQNISCFIKKEKYKELEHSVSQKPLTQQFQANLFIYSHITSPGQPLDSPQSKEQKGQRGQQQQPKTSLNMEEEY